MADAVSAKKLAIAHEYKRKCRRHKRTAPQIATLRLNDLAKLYRARYGVSLPDDDAGRDDLDIALHHIATLTNATSRMAKYIEIWAPWLSFSEARRIMGAVFLDPQAWKADQLAWRLRLTAADRATLGITTIGAIDLNKAGRIRARKARAKEREKARRKSLRHKT